MKKVLMFVCVLSLGLIFVSGCGKKEEKAKPPVEKEAVEKEAVEKETVEKKEDHDDHEGHNH